MREGKILAEDSPYSILENLEVSTLEDGFLKLCTKQENLSQTNNSISVYTNNNSINSSGTSRSSIEPKPDKAQRKSSSKQRIKGLLIRNFISLLREPA